MQKCLLSIIQSPAVVSCCRDRCSLPHGSVDILVNLDNFRFYTDSGSNGLWSWHFFYESCIGSLLLISLSSFCLAPTKEFCRSMEDLNTCKRKSVPGGHFTTLPFSTTSTPSGYLKVPGSLIPRSKSSSHLPQNPYGELQISRPSPSNSPKSFSQWDVASTTRKPAEGKTKVTYTHIPSHTHIYVSRNVGSVLSDILTALV